MKKLTIMILAALLNVCAVMAVPAHKGTAKVQQPDGSTLTLRLIGDEWLHFNTTADGYSIVKNNEGYYVYALLNDGQLQPTSQVAHDEADRQAGEKTFLANVKKYQAPDMKPATARMKQQRDADMAKALAARKAGRYNYGNFRGLLILVEFNDCTFSRDDYHNLVDKMLNQENYTGYTDTNGRKVTFAGSVRDYFSDNSDGKFKPQFDVYGPIQVDYSQFDPNGTDNAWDICAAAIEAADPQIDYSEYDRDNDGTVDMVYFIFAGNGANYSGNDSRLYWPHRSGFYGYVKADGVRLGDYASSVELYGYTAYPNSITIDGIGTICHEFGHVLGLPDFYDSDYAQGGGQSNDPGAWSVMAGGSYNNSGRQPIGYSIFERYMVGFANPEVIEAEGSYTLQNVQSSNSGYRINSAVSHEFFMLENRQKDNKWNAYAPGNGMLVFRVDSTNTSVWSRNKVNANPAHNYYEMVRANGWKGQAAASDPFPGTAKVTELNNATTPASLLSWAKKETKWGMTNIRETGGVITFDIENTYILKGIDIEEPEDLTIGVGTSHQLNLVITPAYLKPELSWTSSKPDVASVDKEGRINGLSVGTTIVTVKTTDGKFSASCTVKVEAIPTYENIRSFLQQEDGTSALLNLENAEVLYVNGTTAYVRDASGSAIFNNTGLTVKQNDRLNGKLYLEIGTNNKMREFKPVSEKTDLTAISITAGEAVVPHFLKTEQLSEDYYADFVVIEEAQLVSGGGIYAVAGDKRVRLYNTLKLKNITVPKQLEDKRFTITAIFGTNTLNGQTIDELYLLASPEEDGKWEPPVPEPGPVAVADIQKLKELKENTLAELTLTNAQVLTNDGEEAVIRDATGAITLAIENMNVQINDVLNGTIVGTFSNEDGMAYLESVEGKTKTDTYTISEGTEAEPIIVTIADLLALDNNAKLLASPLTSNLVKIVDAAMKKDQMFFFTATDASTTGNIYVLANPEDSDIIMPMNTEGKKYDVTGLFGHLYDEDASMDMLAIVLTKSPEEKDETGLLLIDLDAASSAPTYNLSGQRVGKEYKGIVIRSGRRVINTK